MWPRDHSYIVYAQIKIVTNLDELIAKRVLASLSVKFLPGAVDWFRHEGLTIADEGSRPEPGGSSPLPVAHRRVSTRVRAPPRIANGSACSSDPIRAGPLPSSAR
jgi:hypothetical protein